ncbi:MAG: hypothetical protein HETSPECPRED_003970 [Heterodermia speciosa]|uniref:Heme haloperoxidase family profile domain-containing protein n=1 Tax=Heterodermia speciosa TaxID=116794 RepID=A0A8H3IKX0_9LECA|nr:MAG: hypothetical protein HETSPECPRED_003970 [Heterodermia speciosa]
MLNHPDVDSSLLAKRSQHERRQTTCPNNPNHQGAVPFNQRFPYTGAQNGLPGTQIGGVVVPDVNDVAHKFDPPGPLDIRGPCPGLNTAANHHFISHDGITNYAELLDAQQNLYNVGFDLASALAAIGVALTGDPVTTKMSIGCDATSRTSLIGSLLGSEGGLDAHNKFEADTSLTRSDYFLAEPNDFSFNGTLFGMMAATTGGNFNLSNMALYMSQRYAQSKADNPNFYFGPKSILLYGAASFLFELFPSLGIEGNPSLPVQKFFFGATDVGGGKFVFNNAEQIPPNNWFNRRRAMTLVDVASDFVQMYGMHPVQLGGNVGKNNFNAMGSFGTAVTDGQFSLNINDVICLLYQIATDNVPDSLNSVLTLPSEVLKFTTGKLNPIFEKYGCALKLT